MVRYYTSPDNMTNQNTVRAVMRTYTTHGDEKLTKSNTLLREGTKILKIQRQIPKGCYQTT